jgi:hypothetical protein
MNWNDQLWTSLIWLGEAFVISSIGLALTIYGLTVFTDRLSSSMIINC